MLMKLIYAVGDIHGMYDKLIASLEAINKHNVQVGCADHKVVFLGDYVDRGPDSRKVVEHVKMLIEKDADTYKGIIGNHEDMMFEGRSHWYQNGGDKTVESYNGDRNLMEEHIKWLMSLPVKIETENYIFVHAGLDPDTTVKHQSRNTMLWVRHWWNTERDFGKHVVYGHTPFHNPMLKNYSTGLDTGAVFGGKLSVGVFDAEVNKGPITVLQV
jgi:serine/threonine protein phosphatase 1